jgi:hypothetical protein
MAKKEKVKPSPIYDFFNYLHKNIQVINSSKIFAGVMIIILNIASKFVTFKLSKSMESYLKYTFSRQVLVFAITWMGTRDIYIAFIMSMVFIIFTDYLLNEESAYCFLPKDFTEYHVNLLNEEPTNIVSQNIAKTSERDKTNSDMITEEEIARAQEVLDKAKIQNTQLNNQSFTPFNASSQ